MKLKPQVEIFEPETMRIFGELAGWSLAASHARSGDSAKIAGYLGKKDEFDEAIADFSESYADQNERDHQTLVQAVRDGRLEARIDS
jgi:NAD(P)H-dependent flavin oxidoreductase YrpB (nitropropane dioxygenase family)